MTDEFLDAIERRPLREQIVERVRMLIITGELPAGEKISEKMLCEQFNVSRTPLREALRTLAAENLVELRPNRGAIVTPLHNEQLAEIFPVLAVLEAFAAEDACRRRDPELLQVLSTAQIEMERCHSAGDRDGYFRANERVHAGILEVADNPTLTQLVRRLSVQVRRHRYQANSSDAGWEKAVAEHRWLLEAFQAGDADRAREVMTQHLRNKATGLDRCCAADD